VASVGLGHAYAKGANRVESAVGHGTYAAGRAAGPLTNLPEGSLSETSSAAGDGLAQPLARPETALTSAVDQVLGALAETISHDPLIGDLAFEQVSSGTRRESTVSSLFRR